MTLYDLRANKRILEGASFIFVEVSSGVYKVLKDKLGYFRREDYTTAEKVVSCMVETYTLIFDREGNLLDSSL